MVCLCALLCCISGVRAEDTTFGPDEEGRGFFIAGRAAYVAGRYEEALERFERSYEMSGRAELLYNVGAAAERAGKPARALAAYREFLEKKPESELRPEVEARIAELQAKQPEEPVAEAAPEPSSEDDGASTAAPSEAAAPAQAVQTPEPAPPPSLTNAPPRNAPPREAASHTTWHNDVRMPIAALAASGAVLAGGAVLIGLGYAAEARVREAPDGARWADYRDDASHALTFRGAGFAIGAVGAVGAVLSSWWLVRVRKDRRGSGLLVGSTSLGYRGTF